MSPSFSSCGQQLLATKASDDEAFSQQNTPKSRHSGEFGFTALLATTSTGPSTAALYQNSQHPLASIFARSSLPTATLQPTGDALSVETLLARLQSSCDAVQCNAAGALANLALSETVQQQLAQPELFKVLTGVAATAQCPGVLRFVAMTLLRLAQQDATRDVFACDSALRAVVVLTHCSSSTVRRQGARILAVLTFSVNLCPKIASLRVIDVIVELAKSDHLEMQQDGLRSLAFLSAHVACHTDLLSHGAFSLFVEHATSPTSSSTHKLHAANFFSHFVLAAICSQRLASVSEPALWHALLALSQQNDGYVCSAAGVALARLISADAPIPLPKSVLQEVRNVLLKLCEQPTVNDVGVVVLALQLLHS